MQGEFIYIILKTYSLPLQSRKAAAGKGAVVSFVPLGLLQNKLILLFYYFSAFFSTIICLGVGLWVANGTISGPGIFGVM